MKSIIKNEEVEQKDEYPCLKLGRNNLVVLFESYDKGIVVHNGNTSWQVGNYMEGGWAMDAFKPFTGTIELSN